MATPFLVGVGAVATALLGRQLYRAGYLGARRIGEEFAKGGFHPKMDRKEAIAILGLK
jgi:DnaJ family protein C protein 19